MSGEARMPEAAARLDGVSVFYGEVLGLSRVDMEIAPGITGIVGPNGSGKSTLMKVLTGLVPPKEGEVRVPGGDPFRDAAARSRVSFVPATECFYGGLSGRRNLEVTFLAQGHGARACRELVQRALALAGLSEHGHRRYATWSRGMRQRLKLGLVLAEPRELVLLDEPFLGVDPPTRQVLREQILALAQAGRAVLLSSHVLSEIEALTDRVGVLAFGRLLGFGRIADLLVLLRDRHPHRVRLTTDAPRPLAAALAALPHLLELRFSGAEELEFVTARPDLAYRELPRLVAGCGALVRRVSTVDAGLDAVFRHVTAAGGRRL